MGRAPQSQRRRFGRGEVLLPPTPAPAQPLSGCLDALQKTWRQEGSWQRFGRTGRPWPAISSPHCRPLSLRNGVLTVGASHPQWRQALLYSNCSCWRRLCRGPSGEGSAHPAAPPDRTPTADDPLEDWKRHPSRIDVHGIAPCPRCGTPSPVGEMAQWGHCSFCRRIELSQATAVPEAEATARDARQRSIALRPGLPPGEHHAIGLQRISTRFQAFAVEAPELVDPFTSKDLEVADPASAPWLRCRC